MSGYCVKLVRDDIAKVMPNCGGGEVYFKPVGRTTHVRLLKEKLGEEVTEYLVNGSLGELADILEAVECLALYDEGADFVALRAEQKRKRKERGGFYRGTAMFTRDPKAGPNA